jgi:excisionase family DNA binding protein
VEASTTKGPYLDYEAASRYCNLHRVTLWRAALRDGTLRASGYGRAVRFHVKDLDEFMTSRNRK